MLVAAIDVGSPSKMGWANHDGLSGCGDPKYLIRAIADALSREIPVSLGFEAPLWTPRGRAFNRMTANRGGVEASMRRPWSAGAGCGALGAGIANMAWIFERLEELVGSIKSTTQLGRFQKGEAALLIWEAFVSGDQKASSHEADAEIAVGAFVDAWPNLLSAIEVEPSVNLAAAALLSTGHDIDPNELSLPGVVIAAQQKENANGGVNVNVTPFVDRLG